jgi:CYTH domain-containing protein/predicted ATPase
MEKIIIDGGPCSGKTTGLAKISERLMELGIIPFIVPEAATLLIQSGITPKLIGIHEFQKEIILLQIHTEGYWEKAAQRTMADKNKPGILFHDRGLLTGSAYLELGQGENQLEKFQREVLWEVGEYNVEEIRARYKGVIHLVTAANGAEKYYTLANNSARKETPEEARALDERTKASWLGHPHLAIVPNKDKDGIISFDRKIKNMLAEVFRIIGYPIPIELEDKFKLRSFDPAKLPVKCEATEITQTYLIPEDIRCEERVRMRTWMGFSSYFRTIKSPGPDGGRIEIEDSIPLREYQALLERENRNASPIRKTRYCFLWKDQYFEVDAFHGKLEGKFFMERERTDKNDMTDLPPFIDVEENVTGQ